MRASLLMGAILGVAGCTGTDTAENTAPTICREGSRWEMGQVAFREATAAWNLDTINPTGLLMSAVDVDGDGWTDLAIRRFDGPDDFTEDGARTHWLLRNDEGRGFVDVTQASGVMQRRDASEDAGRFGPVWAFGDVDNDGNVDVFTGAPVHLLSDPNESTEIMLNQGDGTFRFGPASSELRRSRDDQSSGATFVDIDRDGNLDLFVSQYPTAQDLLYRGDGSGDFVEIMADAGTETVAWNNAASLNEGRAHSNAWSAAACDVNNDGWPDLMAASYGRAPNHLWQNNGDGTFANQSVASGFAYDARDDWSDNESARCYCTLNPDAPDCGDVPAPEVIACEQASDVFRWNHTNDREAYRLGGNSGAVTCADVNNDGWLDLMTSEIVHWDVGSSSDPSELLLNMGEDDVRFERPGNASTGLTRPVQVPYDNGDITNSVFDFDNDGWKDIYIGASEYPGNRGLLYHQNAPEQFAAVPIDEGVDHFRSHGSVVADFDRDGDLDLIVGHSRSRCDSDCYETSHVRFFENQMGDASNFLQLRLEGTDANRSAIGARVSVTTDDGITQILEIGGGKGHYGNQDDLVAHFGLGTSCEADVTVTWPDASGATQAFSVGGGYRYHVVQGRDPVVE
ncbi:MAG: CRTAC1 family protein [Myxococcota bacterium]